MVSGDRAQGFCPPREEVRRRRPRVRTAGNAGYPVTQLRPNRIRRRHDAAEAAGRRNRQRGATWRERGFGADEGKQLPQAVRRGRYRYRRKQINRPADVDGVLFQASDGKLTWQVKAAVVHGSALALACSLGNRLEYDRAAVHCVNPALAMQWLLLDQAMPARDLLG